MTNPNGPRSYDDLERGAADVLEAMRLASRLLRALAPLASEMRELQTSLVQLQEATQWQLPAGPALPPGNAPPAEAEHDEPAAPVAESPIPDTVPPAPLSATVPEAPEPAAAWQRRGPEAPPPPSPEPDPSAATPAPPAQHDALRARPEPEAEPERAPTLSPTVEAIRPAPAPVAAPAETLPPESPRPTQAARRRTVSVTVTRGEGPLDLVRVHGALDGLPGVTGLALASYTRGRANILLDTDRAPEDLAVRDALLQAFPEGVDGEWVGDNEYVATIGAHAA
jgi:hypothetical protein